MRVGGAWVGWGLGDWSHFEDGSDRDPAVRKFKAFARRMYRSYMGDLDDTNKFDQQLFDRLILMQDKLVAGGQLVIGFFIRGVLDLETEYASGFRKRPPNLRRPVVITVEGHMSNMWIGPCAAIGAQLEAEGLCWHQPIGYNSTKLPFDDSATAAVLDVLARDRIGPFNERPFDLDVDWYLLGFSRGAIGTNKVWLNHLRGASAGSRLARRRDKLQRAIAFGDPYREKNVTAGWWPDEPKPGTQGISDVRMDHTPPWWRSANRDKDLYTCNTDDEVGLNKTAIYKIAAENSWWGGPAGLLARVMDAYIDPFDGIIDITRSIIGGVMFLSNMGPHGGYNLDAPTDYIRRGLRGEPRPGG